MYSRRRDGNTNLDYRTREGRWQQPPGGGRRRTSWWLKLSLAVVFEWLLIVWMYADRATCTVCMFCYDDRCDLGCDIMKRVGREVHE